MPVGDIVVDPRIQTRHPDVSADSVRVAWSNVVRFMAREDTDPLRYVAVGYDEYGRLLEMVAVLDESDRWCELFGVLVFRHADLFKPK